MLGDIQLGSITGRQFLIKGWPPLDEQKPSPGKGLHWLESPAEIRFYLIDPAALQLTGKYECSTSEALDINVRCNGQEVGSTILTPGSNNLSIQLPSTVVQTGENRLSFSFPDSAQRKVLWREFKVQELAEQPSVDGSDLVIPPESHADFYFLVRENSRLSTGSITTQSGKVRMECSTPSASLKSSTASSDHWQLPLPSDWVGKECRWRIQAGDKEVRISDPELWYSRLETETQAPTLNPKRNTPPLVLVVCVDTLRADALGCYGGPESPGIDKLAADSLLFKESIAQSSWTKSTIASVFTGQTVLEHGVLGLADKVETDHVMLGEIFQQAGYRTAGLIANRWVSTDFGFDQGFDQYEWERRSATPLIDDAIQLLQSHDRSSKPLFLYLHLLDPHDPYTPPKPFLPESLAGANGSSKQIVRLQGRSIDGEVVPTKEVAPVRGLYQAEVSYVDAQLDRLFGAIKAQGLYQDGLIVVFSDHGEGFLDHGLMRHGNSLYKELLQVPTILKLPQGEKAGQQSDSEFQSIDLGSTILGASGLQIPESFHGFDHSNGEVPPARVVKNYVDYGFIAEFSDSKSRWRRVLESAKHGTKKLHIRRVDTWAYKWPMVEYFDLAADPSERDELHKVNPVSLGFLWNELDKERALKLDPERARLKDVEAGLRAIPYIR